MRNKLAIAYESRRPMLEHVAHALENEVKEYLSSVFGIGRICFSALSTKHFLETVEANQGPGGMTDPLLEIEDQISGGVVVASERELIAVETRLKGVFSSVERNWRETGRSATDGLPTRCLICVIPPQVKPPGWDVRDDVPNTFEIQIRIDLTLHPPTTGSTHTLPFRDDATDSRPPPATGRVLFGLHGIRTHAGWCRALYEVALPYGWQVRMDRWNFGYFNIVLFLLTFARAAKVRWFREVYRHESKDKEVQLEDGQYPSIVAHSFGTYILGNALLKYDWLRFDKVILCGSILPRDFPWDELIERGQVQAVRNEYGTNDTPTRVVRWFVAGTGPSGREGFSRSHARIEQERFEYTHSEYFNKGHMEAKWLPFLDRHLPLHSVVKKRVERPKASHPCGLYLLYALVIAAAYRYGFLTKVGVCIVNIGQAWGLL